MERKTRITVIPFLLIAALVALIIMSYKLNVGAFLSNGSEPANLLVSLLYILIWLALLSFSLITKSKEMLRFFIAFWVMEVIYFALYLAAMNVPAIGWLFFYGICLFFLPLIGFDLPYSLLADALKVDFLYDFITLPFLFVSVMMLAAGLLAKKKQN